MTAVIDRWWFTLLLWASLGLLYLVGGTTLVWFALAHVACNGCTTQPKDTALTIYFVAGLGVIVATAIVAAAMSERVPPRKVLLPGLGAILLTFASSFAILLTSLPR